MFGPDNNHLIERLLALAIQNEEARQRLLTIQINNENYRTELLWREHELVEASAAQVAATVKAQEELAAAREAQQNSPELAAALEQMRRDDKAHLEQLIALRGAEQASPNPDRIVHGIHRDPDSIVEDALRFTVRLKTGITTLDITHTGASAYLRTDPPKSLHYPDHHATINPEEWLRRFGYSMSPEKAIGHWNDPFPPIGPDDKELRSLIARLRSYEDGIIRDH